MPAVGPVPDKNWFAMRSFENGLTAQYVRVLVEGVEYWRDEFSYLYYNGLLKGNEDLFEGKMIVHLNRNRFDDQPNNLKLVDISEAAISWEISECFDGESRWYPMRKIGS